jgi:hypothetical protein
VRTPKVGLGAIFPAFGVIVVVAAAAAVWHNLPTPTDVYGPFDVRGAAGEPVHGRAVTANVTSVRIAPQVNSVQAAGSWVVVDTTLDASLATELPRADLIVGPNSYVPSDRYFLDTLGAEIAPGITARGSWVFDVASQLVEPGASETITLRVWVGTDILDSRLVIDVPAGDPRISWNDDVKVARSVMSAG